MATGSLSTATEVTSERVEMCKALFGKHPHDVIATISGAADKLSQLGCLFAAISLHSQQGSAATSAIQQLAALGNYSAGDAADWLDAERANWSNALEFREVTASNVVELPRRDRMTRVEQHTISDEEIRDAIGKIANVEGILKIATRAIQAGSANGSPWELSEALDGAIKLLDGCFATLNDGFRERA